MKRKALGTYVVAKICQVAPITVGRWIEEGKLPFFTTGGGHRRVWDSDLVKFLRAHNYPIPSDLNSSLHPTILIVEDEAVTRRFIRRALEKGYPKIEILEATDGFEAGGKISNLSPLLVILDVWLPGIDGIKVCEWIRQNRTTKNVKVLAISGDQIQETKEKILKAGADVFLAKPFTIEDLLKAVSKLVLVR